MMIRLTFQSSPSMVLSDIKNSDLTYAKYPKLLEVFKSRHLILTVV